MFGVPVRGSLVLPLCQSLLYVPTALAISVFISKRTSSQRVAMIMALAGMLLPTLMLSGFVFPIDSMPRPLQLLSNAFPAKWRTVPRLEGVPARRAGPGGPGRHRCSWC